MPPVQWFLYQIAYFFTHFWHGLANPSRCRLPASGPAILAATHFSSVDPLLLQASCRRLLHWMVAREYYELSWARWIFRLTGSVPVNRTGQDTAATRQALRLLRDGQVIAIFPYGRIRRDSGEPLELKEGAALLALAAGVPLIPARIRGIRHRSMAGDWLRPHKQVIVEFGRPIDLSDLYDRGHDREAVAEASRRLAEALNE